MLQEMRILILPKAKYPANRPMLNALWNTEISALNNRLFWVMQSRNTHLRPSKKRWDGSIIYLIPTFGKKGLYFRFLDTVLNFFCKFILSVILVKKYKIDVIHVHDGAHEGLVSLLVSKMCRVRTSYAYTSHFILTNQTRLHYMSNYFKMLKQIQFAIEKQAFTKILRKSDLVFPISYSLGTEIHRSLHIPYEKMFIVPEAASAFFLKHAKNKNSIYNNPKRIIYVGSLGAKRDIPFIIDVFDLVVKEYEEVQLLLLGWPEQDGDIEFLKDYVRQKSLKEKIHFLETVSYEQVPEIVSASDIGLSAIPPLDEYLISTPTKCIEYLALKVAVVANMEIHEQNYIVNSSKGGILTRYDRREFADGILVLLRNSQLMVECATNGYEWISQHRTFSKLAKGINNQLLSLIG